jgi:hypothetical protein
LEKPVSEEMHISSDGPQNTTNSSNSPGPHHDNQQELSSNREPTMMVDKMDLTSEKEEVRPTLQNDTGSTQPNQVTTTQEQGVGNGWGHDHMVPNPQRPQGDLGHN